MAVQITNDNGYLHRTRIFTGNNNFSFSCWFRLSSTGRYHSLFVNGDNNGNGFDILVHTSNIVRVDISNVGNVNHATSLSTNTWYQLIVVRSSGTWSIYLNNGTPATGSHTPNTSYGSSQTALGSYYYQPDGHESSINGSIAYAAFWDRVITSQERTDLQTKVPTEISTSNLLMYLPFVSGDLGDNLGSAGDFTVAGSPAFTANPFDPSPPAGIIAKVKVGGTFVDGELKTKIAGTFTEKPILVKSGGSF